MKNRTFPTAPMPRFCKCICCQREARKAFPARRLVLNFLIFATSVIASGYAIVFAILGATP